MQDLKDYGGMIVVLLLAILGSGMTYSAAQATSAATLSNHELRISTVEKIVIDLAKDNGELKTTVAVMKQHVDDIWHDNGHKDGGKNNVITD